MSNGTIDLDGLPVVTPGENDYLVGTQNGNARKWRLPDVTGAVANLNAEIDALVATKDAEFDAMMAQTQADAALVIDGLGYATPVPYAAGIEITASRQTVEYNGDIYAPLTSALPFTTSGTFETANFRVIQGVERSALAAASGSSLVGFQPSGTAAVPRTAQAKMRDIVSVKDFGAVGDGVADDSDAFEAAIESGAAGIFVPDGTYLLTRKINITDRSFVLAGAGRTRSKLLWNSALGGINFVTTSDQHTLDVSDLDFSTTAEPTDYAIYVEHPLATSARPGHVKIRDVQIRGETRLLHYFNVGICIKNSRSNVISGVSVTGRFDEPVYGDRAIWLEGKSINSVLYDCNVGGYLYGYYVGGDSEGAQFYYCQSSLLKVGIQVHTTAGRPHVVVDSCHMNTADVGIKIINAVQLFVRGNLLYSSAQGGGYASTGYTGIHLEQALSNIDNAVISNNIVVGLQSVNEDGLKIVGTANFVTCTDNQWYSLTGTGMLLNSSISNSTFVNNMAPSTTTYATGIPAAGRGTHFSMPDGAGRLVHTVAGSVRAEDSASCGYVKMRKSRGEIGTPTAVAAGDLIGRVQWEAFDGTNWLVAGLMQVQASAAPSGGAIAAVAHVNVPFRFPSYTVANAPAANATGGGAGTVIYVSNGNAGAPCLAVSNGTSWLRVPLGAAISAA